MPLEKVHMLIVNHLENKDIIQIINFLLSMIALHVIYICSKYIHIYITVL